MPFYGCKVNKQTVVDPVSVFIATAYLISYFGLSMYFCLSLFTNYSTITASLFEYKAGSIPDSDQPPTPSAIKRTFGDVKIASSPPLSAF